MYIVGEYLSLSSAGCTSKLNVRNVILANMKHIILITLLLCTIVLGNEYTITSFASGKVMPASANAILEPISGTALQPVSTPTIEPGQLILRRKFGVDNYSLFAGRLKSGASDKLSVFKMPAGISFANAVNIKFYTSEDNGKNGSTTDITDAYFDGELLYLDNRSSVSFQWQGSWQTLKALAERPSSLTVTSEPAGAKIFIDGVEKGLTPYTISSIFEPSVVIRLQKEGFYIQEDFVDLQGGKQVSKNFKLIPAVRFSDNTIVDATAYTAENTEDADEIANRITAIDGQIKLVKEKSNTALADFEKAFPAIVPQDEFEKLTEFAERKNRYFQDKSTKKAQLTGEYDVKVADLIKVQSKIREYLVKVEGREYSRFFDGSLLQLGKYDPDNEFFPVTANIKESQFEFTFSGKLAISRDRAREFKQGGTGQGKLKLVYLNKKIKVGQAAYFVFLKDFSMKFKDADYTLNGEITFPSSLVNSPAYRQINEQILAEKKQQQQQQQRLKQEEELKRFPNMAKIPAGSFMMGSPSGIGSDDERPQHRVTLDGFLMDKTEVTQAEYTKVMGSNPSGFKNCPSCPVEIVNWSEAKSYCEKVGKRLPTEAEWEYACRAGTTTQYYWGNEMDGNYGWFDGNSSNKTHPVGEKKPNAWGLYDMSGNVWEWCSDWYDEGYYKSSPESNPSGASSGRYRVLRGGSWGSNGSYLRSGYRDWDSPDRRAYINGFRCAR
jgi:formylglycine-generating enzyme required for sulfatase activity